jgi:sialate O-acetylesterase
MGPPPGIEYWEIDLKGMTTRSLFISLLLFSFSGLLRAAPVPHSLFSDHMVLRRDRAIPVWGTAEPGEVVTVSLSSGVRATSTADPQGRWKAMLPALHAGGPFTMRIEGRDGAVVLRDVMIGEVWVLSGQSNMTYELERASNSGEALASANRPDIRLFTVARNSALEPQTQPEGKWEECTPDSAKSFSAVACPGRSHPQLVAGELG